MSSRTIELLSLDGSNPLHLFAALGALLVTTDADAGCKLHWEWRNGAYIPILTTTLERSAWATHVAESASSAGRVSTDPARTKTVQARKAKINAELKKIKDRIKLEQAQSKAEAKASGLIKSDAMRYASPDLVATRAEAKKLEFARTEVQNELAAELGFGPAHLGDIIGVSPALFRCHAQKAYQTEGLHARTLDTLAALASDACADTKTSLLRPTPFSFSNGGAGQFLLKDFRSLSALITPAKVMACATGEGYLSDDATSLNWDPMEVKSYAYQWMDPGKEASKGKATDCVTNALAYLGLGMLPVIPVRKHAAAVGYIQGEERGLRWVLWRAPLAVSVIRALLAEAPDDGSPSARLARTRRGILAAYGSAILVQNKRNYFAPSTPR
jgi:hypothetical protein